MQKLKVTEKDGRALRSIAASLRRRSEQAEPAFSTRQIIDACFPGTVVSGRKMPAECHEMVLVDDLAFRSHRAPHVIFYNRGLSTAQQRYAIAHAVGHIVFDGKNTGGCGKPFDDRERRCDAFADELLVPAEFLRDYVSLWSDGHDAEAYWDQVDQIASHFQVPQDVIDRRIHDVRRLVKN